MNRRKERYLLDLLDETKRIITATNVIREFHIGRFTDDKGPVPFNRTAQDIVGDALRDNLMSALMVAMGYRIPDHVYGLNDYCDLCNWLGSREEDGKQRWNDE